MDSKTLKELRKHKCFNEHDGHFFAITQNNWMTDESFGKLVTKLQSVFGGRCDSFAVWFIPFPEDMDYMVNDYNGNPMVEEKTFIGSFKL